VLLLCFLTSNSTVMCCGFSTGALAAVPIECGCCCFECDTSFNCQHLLPCTATDTCVRLSKNDRCTGHDKTLK
jgi:hypothetical protein